MIDYWEILIPTRHIPKSSHLASHSNLSMQFMRWRSMSSARHKRLVSMLASIWPSCWFSIGKCKRKRSNEGYLPDRCCYIRSRCLRSQCQWWLEGLSCSSPYRLFRPLSKGYVKPIRLQVNPLTVRRTYSPCIYRSISQRNTSSASLAITARCKGNSIVPELGSSDLEIIWSNFRSFHS